MNTTKKTADKNASDSVKDNAKERAETLQKYVSDMMAVEEHIGSAVKRQAEDENLSKQNPQARQIINSLVQITERHEQELKSHLESIGGDTGKSIKEVATAALGSLAGLYDKVRTEAVSKMLRDDYTAVNLAAIGYTMLHTTGLAFNDQATASLALRYLKDYTPIIMQFNEIIPSVVVAELRDSGTMVNESAIQQAVSNTQAAWQPSDSQKADGKNGSSKSGTGNGTVSNGKATSTASKPKSSNPSA